MGERKYPVKRDRRFFCRKCNKAYQEAEVKDGELINGRWYKCLNCGARLYQTPGKRPGSRYIQGRTLDTIPWNAENPSLRPPPPNEGR